MSFWFRCNPMAQTRASFFCQSRLKNRKFIPCSIFAPAVFMDSLMFWLYRSRASRRPCSGVLTQKGMIRPGENGILAVYLDLSWDGRKACELSLIQKSQHVVVYNRTRSIKTEKTNVEVDRQRITAEYDSRWSDVSVNLSNQERGSKRIYISIVSNQTNRVGGKNDLLIHD